MIGGTRIEKANKVHGQPAVLRYAIESRYVRNQSLWLAPIGVDDSRTRPDPLSPKHSTIREEGAAKRMRYSLLRLLGHSRTEYLDCERSKTITTIMAEADHDGGGRKVDTNIPCIQNSDRLPCLLARASFHIAIYYAT